MEMTTKERTDRFKGCGETGQERGNEFYAWVPFGSPSNDFGCKYWTYWDYWMSL